MEGFNSCISNIEFSIMCDCIEVRGSSKEDVEKCWLVIKGTLIDTLSRINVPVSNEKDKFIVRESPRRAKSTHNFTQSSGIIIVACHPSRASSCCPR